MNELPAQRPPTALELPVTGPPPVAAEGEFEFAQAVGILRRNFILITVCVALALAVAWYITSRTTPVYEASVTVRLEEKTPNLPGFFKTASSGSELNTEAEVLQSRTLAEDVVKELRLQLRVIAPEGVERSKLVDSIQIDSSATRETYELHQDGTGRFVVLKAESTDTVARVAPGQRLRLPGATFRLLRSAAEFPSLELAVRPSLEAAQVLLGRFDVDRAGRDVKILELSYEDTDRDLVWRVPNALVGRFIAQRAQYQKEEARSTVAFLRRQLDTLSQQLLGAENAVREYRERNLVVSPEAEASNRVSRLISMQAERSTVEGEQAALAKLLADVDAQAARKEPEAPSPYRQLLAFPTLLRSQAAADLLSSLSAVEQERTTLLARRTLQDPDVKALDSRVHELEGQLRSVVAAYLQGLRNQITTIDASLVQYGQQLGRLPQRELEVARLERQPKVLGEIYTLLQTRLKEAEIAEAAQDPSVRLVDPAIRPRWPVRPKRSLNLLAGLVGGLVLGMALTAVRELRDRAVRTRADVHVATGLPVLGLIPRIPVRGRRFALIAERGARRKAEPRPAAPTDPPRYVPRTTAPLKYTFFSSDADETAVELAAPLPPPEPAGPPANILQLAISELGMPMAEAYSILETNIAFARADGAVRLVMLTSPLPGDGKTTTAVNLALSLARRGLSVVLIDADLRRGMVHAAFDAPREPGLSDVLQDRISFARARGWVEVEGQMLHYLTAGGMVRNPTGTVSSSEMRDLLTRLRDQYDLIIVDSPPTNIVTDASLVAGMCDGVLMVARAGVTEPGALSVAMDQLRHVRAPLLGVIINDIDFKRDGTYDSAYRYYNYSQYIHPARG